MQVTTEKPAGYMIPVGESDRQRLDALGAIFNPTSLELMKSFCFSKNPKILDVGCGNGSLTRLFAKTFSDSTVVGVDISAEQINVSMKIANEENLNNISWAICDVYHLENLKEKHSTFFDVVHSRFVLTHLADLPRAVDQMLSMLKPGGLLILEEVGAKNTFKVTPNKAIKAWKKMVDLLHRLQHSHDDTTERVLTYLSNSDKVSCCTSKLFDIKIEGQLKKSMFRIGAEHGIKTLAEIGQQEHIKELGYDDSKAWLDEMLTFETDDTATLELENNESIIATKA